MMLWNVKDPEAVWKLWPWFVPADQSRGDILLELSECLKKRPDETFCCMAIENKIGQALLVARCRKYDVGIWQARARAGFKYQRLLLDSLTKWAKSKGYSMLAAGVPDTRRQICFNRRYGFQVTGPGLMEKQI